MKRIFVLYISLFSLLQVWSQENFSFVFYTDVHFKSDSVAVNGFTKAVSIINTFNPDFIVDGGDFLFDMNHKTWKDIEADYELYQECKSQLEAPVYHVLGNHDVVGASKKYREKTNPKYQGKALIRNMNEGESYSSFTHKGWHFFLLDCIQTSDSVMMSYYVDEEQLGWLSENLAKIDKDEPIVLISHIPFMTASAMYKSGPLARNSAGKVIANAAEVLKRCRAHNLKLTLSGHLHQYENITIDNKQFVISGAVSGFWWRGPFGNTPEGFILIEVENGEPTVGYVTY